MPPVQLDAWMNAAGWERLLNRQGTTWRKLDVALREATVDAASARRLMLEQPSVIKRPVVRWPTGQITVGFDPVAFTAALPNGAHELAARA